MSNIGIKQIVLAVDDMPENIEFLERILCSEYTVKTAESGEKAIEIAQTSPQPDLIILDVMMPGMDGFETCARLKSDPFTKEIPIIFLTALCETENESRGLDMGAADYIIKPFNPRLLKARVRNHLELKLHRDHLGSLVAEKTRELALTRDVTIHAMASIAESRDPETGAHIYRTKNYIKALAQQLKSNPLYIDRLDDEYIQMVHKSAPLHDIGKVAICDSILLKPGKLTEEEFEKMKAHTIYGYNTIKNASRLLGENSFLKVAQQIAVAHHEKWDGSGYPYGLSGESIPLAGRLMAVVDNYDALISKRVYKPAFDHDRAVGIITGGQGTRFDPHIIDAFYAVAPLFREIAQEYSDEKDYSRFFCLE